MRDRRLDNAVICTGAAITFSIALIAGACGGSDSSGSGGAASSASSGNSSHASTGSSPTGTTAGSGGSSPSAASSSAAGGGGAASSSTTTGGGGMGGTASSTTSGAGGSGASGGAGGSGGSAIGGGGSGTGGVDAGTDAATDGGDDAATDGGEAGQVTLCAPHDGFDSSSFWVPFSGTSAFSTITGSQAVVEVDDADGGNPGYGGYTTATAYSLVDCGVSIHVVSVLATNDPTATTFFSAPRVDGTHVLHMFVVAGVLYAEVIDSDTGESASSATPYDPVAHAYLRIHDQGGTTVFFDTSPDGLTWSTLLSAPHPGFLDASPYVFGIGAGSEETAGGMPWFARFDDFD